MISNLHENFQCSRIFALVAIEYLGFGPDEVLQIMWCTFGSHKQDLAGVSK